MPASEPLILVDGSVSFDGGVNSVAVTTIASATNPNGLQRNELAWLENGTMRDGGITTRAGWHKIATIPCDVLSALPPEHYYLSFVSEWIVPPVGSTVNVVLTQVYPGLNGDTFFMDGFWKADIFASFGRFEVVSGAGTTNITIRLIEETSVPPGDSVHDFPIVYHFFATHPNPCQSPYGRMLFQGKHPYKPVGAFPYEIWSVSGNILRVNADGTTTNLSVQFGLYNSATAPHAYFVQGKQFMVIQSGDNVTLPLIWDGTTLRRSNGLTGNVGQPSQVVHEFTATAFFKIPIVGATVTIATSAAYAGAINDVGVLRGVGGSFDIGEFEVTATAANSITIETISSAHIGENFPPFNYQFTLTAIPTPVLINEIPAATAMRYYALRIWYTIGSVVSAGDILFGQSGTQPYNFADSILKVTENPLAISGDGFEMPGDDGNITGLQYGANIDASLGQGRLFAFTRKAVYGIQVPVNRIDWIGADANNQPLITVVQLVNGSVNDRSIVPVNGDLYYQSLEPGIRSLNQSVRQFSMAGNRLLSANEQRLFQFQDRSLMDDVSGIYFHNRLWETVLPRQTDFGIVHDAMVPLDFMPISTLQQERQSNWEGVAYGIPIFQVAVLDFGGRERAFATVLQEDNTLGLWEVTTAERFDFSSDITLANRVKMRIEFPAFNIDRPFDLKKLVSAEMYVDRVFGEVVFTMEYRPDGQTCPLHWHTWKICSPRNSAETCVSPISYPLTEFGECFKSTMVLPVPPSACSTCNTGRPANIAYQFQPILTVYGFCRIRGLILHMEPVLRQLYKGIVC